MYVVGPEGAKASKTVWGRGVSYNQKRCKLDAADSRVKRESIQAIGVGPPSLLHNPHGGTMFHHPVSSWRVCSFRRFVTSSA